MRLVISGPVSMYTAVQMKTDQYDCTYMKIKHENKVLCCIHFHIFTHLYVLQHR